MSSDQQKVDKEFVSIKKSVGDWTTYVSQMTSRLEHSKQSRLSKEQISKSKCKQKSTSPTLAISKVNVAKDSDQLSSSASGSERSDITVDVIYKSRRDWTTSENSSSPVTDSEYSTTSAPSSTDSSSLEELKIEEHQD